MTRTRRGAAGLTVQVMATAGDSGVAGRRRRHATETCSTSSSSPSPTHRHRTSTTARGRCFAVPRPPAEPPPRTSDRTLQRTTVIIRHIASTSMYSLTFRVRVATPAQYGRNGTASLQITSHTQQARRFYCWCVRACVVRAACAAPSGLPLGSATHFHNVAIATHSVHRLQIRPIVHN